MTALFGVAMVIIGSTIEIQGGGASLLVDLAARLAERIGTVGSVIFLIGAVGAVFSSLLGVWQAVPYLFADVWSLVRHDPADGEVAGRAAVDTNSIPYRGYLIALATLPMAGLFARFEQVQQVYAVIGASFIPLLAIVLLVLNGSSVRVGAASRNRPATVAVLVAILVFFSWTTVRTVSG
jgi:hypothetical protein